MHFGPSVLWTNMALNKEIVDLVGNTTILVGGSKKK
jgi:hypothetical protein